MFLAMRQPQNAAAIAARKQRVIENERRILALVNTGLSSTQIGRTLRLEPRTVDTYIGRLARRYGVRGKYALVALLRERGLLDVPTSGGLATPKKLNETELRVLGFVAQERSTEEMSRRLRRSVDAVHAVIKGAIRKLQVRTREEAVAKAVAIGELDITLPDTIPNPLTSRECEILALLDSGRSIREIADGLGRAPLTIASHLNDARHKLRVQSNEEAFRRARNMGAITRSGERAARVPRATVVAIQSEPATIELTRREVDVLWELRETRDTRKLARRLGVGEKTVSYYCGALARALGVAGRIATLQRAEELGLIRNVTLSPNEHLGLTDEQLRILRLLAQGLSYERIADRRGIAYSTVTTFAFTILKALDVRSVREAIQRLGSC